MNFKFRYSCGVLKCGGGDCVHKQLEDKCPHCGYPMIEVTTTGFRFCSNPDTLYGCDYEEDPHEHKESDRKSDPDA